MRLSALEGSVGIVANAVVLDPDELFLALRGSGQSLNIGLAEDAFVVASEPYGLVEETSRYLRMDGEGGGQVVRCSRQGAGTLGGICRWRYDGTELPVLPGRDQNRRDNHQGRGPAGFPAFPVEGDLRVAPIGAQDPARQAGPWPKTAGLSSAWARTSYLPLCARTLAVGPDPARPGRRPGDGGGGRPGGGGRHRQGVARRRGEGHARHGTLRLGPFGCRAAGRHVRRPGRRHQPVGDHHGHQSDRGPRAGTRAHVVVDSEPAQQRPRAEVPRRALHLGRPRHRDERGLNQGVLLSGRGRPPPGLRVGGGGGDGRRGVVRREPGGLAGTALADGKGPGETGGNRPDSVGSGARRAVRGPWSAAVPTVSPPPRCGSSFPSCATRR